MLVLTLKFLLAHLIGDFVFQPNKWVKHKKEHKIASQYLYYHFFIHLVLLLIFTQFSLQYIWPVFIIAISHIIIDIGKIYFENEKNSKFCFFIDQFLHLLVIGIIINYYYPYHISLKILFEAKFLLLFTCLVATTFVTAILLKILLTQWSPKEIDDVGLSNNAGKYIGILERLFIFLFVTINFWEGIGFLLAAKSIFRFGDLKESKDIRLTEYILIGTLLSFGLGILFALLYNQGLTLLV